MFNPTKLIGSEDGQDRDMRALMYLMLSRDGSSQSQKVDTNNRKCEYLAIHA